MIVARKYWKLLFFVWTLVVSPALCQSPPENWILPLKVAVVRTPEALDVVQASVLAMNPQKNQSIADYTLSALVSRWETQPVAANLTESAMGLSFESIAVVAGTKTLHRSNRIRFSETTTEADLQEKIINDERIFEHIPRMPLALLQKVQNDPRDTVELLKEDPMKPRLIHIRVRIREKDWFPSMRDLSSSSYDLFFDKDTHYVVWIRSNKHYDDKPQHYVPYEVNFSNYSLDHGYVLPHSIEEMEAGRLWNELSIANVKLNQGLTKANFQQ